MTSGFLQAISAVNAGRFFNTDYAHCRTEFLATASRVPTLAEQRQWSLSGDEQLATDALWLGDKNAAKVWVLISGTHGVEGFCGSAVQRFLLLALSEGWLSLPESTAMVVVHALNPWGMQWARRCDREGVDLNRNFIDFSQLPEMDEHYPEALACFAENNVEWRRVSLVALEKRLGQDKFERLISGGQHHTPWAPFYGGKEPSHGAAVIEALIDEWSLVGRCLTVVDLHSGLGPWAYGELISDHPKNSRANEFARALFAKAVAVTTEGESFSVPKTGLLDYRWHSLMAVEGCFLTLEFGTLGTAELFEVLINDHILWRDGSCSLDDPAYQQQRQAMLDHFCPSEPMWQQAVLLRAWQVAERILSV